MTEEDKMEEIKKVTPAIPEAKKEVAVKTNEEPGWFTALELAARGVFIGCTYAVAAPLLKQAWDKIRWDKIQWMLSPPVPQPTPSPVPKPQPQQQIQPAPSTRGGLMEKLMLLQLQNPVGNPRTVYSILAEQSLTVVPKHLPFLLSRVVYEEPNTEKPVSSPKVSAPTKVIYEEELVRVLRNVYVMLILGWWGAGKSAFGWKVTGYYHDQGRPCYAYGIPKDKRPLLEKWVNHIERLEDLPNGSVLLIDEASLSCFYREPGSDAAKKFTALRTFARHKNQVIILISQMASEVHKNLVRMVDMIFIKNPGVLSLERDELRVPLEGAKTAFAGLNEADRKAYVFAYNGLTGATVFFKTSVPDFWTPEMSHLFDGVNIAEPGVTGAPNPQAQALSSAEMAQKIREYSKANPNISRWELARNFKVSIGSIYNYLDDYPYKKKGRPVSSTPNSTPVST